jgi:hypothetical protein
MTTYTARPAATAKAARRAWDYFSHKYPKRRIKTLCYTPNYQGDFKGWLVEWNFTPEQLDHAMGCWGAMYSTDWMFAAASSAEIRSASR